MKKLTFISFLLFVSITLSSQNKECIKADSISTIPNCINSSYICPIEVMPEFPWSDKRQKVVWQMAKEVESFPQFPGGYKELMTFISNNLTWPDKSGELCIEGRVVVKFLVKDTGELSDIKVVRSLHESFDAEAMRVIKLMPKWIPAQRNGEAVSCYYTLPISFRVSR